MIELNNISFDELVRIISDKVYEISKNNEENLGDKIVLPNVTAQIAVRATLEILEQFGFITLPKKD